MRELDTETPVVWPAWCYQSGESIKFIFWCHSRDGNLLASRPINLINKFAIPCQKFAIWTFVSFVPRQLNDELLIIDFFLHSLTLQDICYVTLSSYVAFDLNSLLMSHCHHRMRTTWRIFVTNTNGKLEKIREKIIRYISKLA